MKLLFVLKLATCFITNSQLYDLEDYEKRTPNFPDRSLANKIQDLETRDFIPGIGFASSLNDLQNGDYQYATLDDMLDNMATYYY